MYDSCKNVWVALRNLSRSPGFTVVAIVTLGVGIGANVAVFTVVDGMILESLPYEEPDRIVHLWGHKPAEGWAHASVSVANFLDWQKRSRAFEELSVFATTRLNLSHRGEPERVGGVRSSANLFQLLGRTPRLGRSFESDDDFPGASPVAIISDGLWRRRFGANPGIVGRTVHLDGVSHTLIGVMPERFVFPDRTTDIWVPSAFEGAKEDRSDRSYSALGRLRDGVSLDEARRELGQIARQLELEHPETNHGWTVRLVLLINEVLGEEVHQILATLMLAVAFVVLIACANVSNLLLSRSFLREKEISLRIALGAGRARLIRQLLTESLVLALLGGAAGLLIGRWGIHALIAIAPPNAPRLENVEMDGTVLLYTLALTLSTGLLFGLLPAVQSSKPRLTEALKEGGQRSAGTPHQRLLSTLVGVEMALAIVLLSLGILMIRSFYALVSQPPGFDPDDLLTVGVSLPAAVYPDETSRLDFFRSAFEELEGLASVRSVAAVNTLPLAGATVWRSLSLEGQEWQEVRERRSVGYLVVSGRYFDALGIPTLAGRVPGRHDEISQSPVAVVNRRMAERFWGAPRRALGGRLRFDGEEPWLRVVGVTADVRHGGLDRAPRPEVYVLHHQAPQAQMTLVLDSETPPAELAPAARGVIRALDPDLPVYDVRTMNEVVDLQTGGPKAVAQVLGTLAAGALILAAVGIYGVLSFGTGRRTYEIGIRRALGAQNADILRLTVHQAALPLAFGAAAGIAGGCAASRGLRAVLFGVTPTDPGTYLLVTAVLLCVGLLAALVPARRAARIDPAVVLRCH